MKKSPQTYMIRIPLTALMFTVLFTTPTVFGATGQFVPLVGIPYITTTSAPTLVDYLNSIYLLLIAVGGLIAVFKIAFAGAKYAMSDVITDKGSAKKDIEGVLIGLAILLLPYVVLSTINPDLVKLDILRNETPIQQNVTPTNPTGGVGINIPITGTDPAKRAESIRVAEEQCRNAGGVPSVTGTANTAVRCSPSPSTSQATLANTGTATFRPSTPQEAADFYAQAKQVCGANNVSFTQTGSYAAGTQSVSASCKTPVNNSQSQSQPAPATVTKAGSVFTYNSPGTPEHNLEATVLGVQYSNLGQPTFTIRLSNGQEYTAGCELLNSAPAECKTN